MTLILKIQAQIFKLKNELDDKNNDHELAEKRIQRLEVEIQDYITRDDGNFILCRKTIFSKKSSNRIYF